MELTDSVKVLLRETAKSLKGSARRVFMARTVKELGPGGQRQAARELGWGRMTIRKGMHELDSGLQCVDAFSLRGRKRAEAQLPNLLTDLQPIAQHGYTDAELPTAETIGTKLNALGYYPQKVAQSQPQKKSPKLTPSST